MLNKTINPQEAFSLSLLLVQRQYPLFGYIIHQLERVFITDDDKLDTMGVGKDKHHIRIKLYINTNFITRIVEQYNNNSEYTMVIAEVIKHEILHIIFGHLEHKFPNAKQKNIAADMSVNSHLNYNLLPKLTYVDDDGILSVRKCITPLDYGFPEKLSLIEYYNLLKDTTDPLPTIKNHEQWQTISGEEDGIKSPSSIFIQDIIKNAKKYNHNSWGNLPFDELVDILDDIVKDQKPKVPWQKVIRNFHTSCFSDEIQFTNKRVSKRYGYRPGMKIKEQCNILIGIDTSGSMKMEDLRMILNELPHINKEATSFDIIECDEEIQRVYKYKHLDNKLKGRGGTDLEPVLEYAEKNRYDGLIFFTDFNAPVIERIYKLPILWVINNTKIVPMDFPYQHGIFLQVQNDGMFEKIYPNFN